MDEEDSEKDIDEKEMEIAEQWIEQVVHEASDGESDEDEIIEKLQRRVPIPVWPPFQDNPNVEFLLVPYGSQEFEELVRIRFEVFVTEQKVDPEAEIDEFEKDCVHFGLKVGEKFVGVCRLRQKYPFMKIERVAILKEYRGSRFGYFLCQKVLEESINNWPELLPIAHAQTESLNFYKRMGGFVVGPEFMEEGIPHFTIAFLHCEDDDYEVSNYQNMEENKFTPGEIDDPAVLENIKRFVGDCQKGNVIYPMDLCLVLSEYSHEIGLWYSMFEQLISLVFISEFEIRTDKQRREVERLFKDLEVMAEHKLHAYPFANVPDYWRKFYFVIRVLQSIWIVNDFEYTVKYCGLDETVFDEEAVRKSSIEYLDKALTMGGRFFNSKIITNRINFLRERLPKVSFNPPAPIVLQRPPSLVNSLPILSIEIIEDETFLDEFICKRRPVIIRKGVKMPAVGKWSLSHLAEVLAYRMFPVEQGSRYTDESWNQNLMQAEEFFEKISNPNHEKGPVYLAQHRLLEQVPELMDDVIIPSYCKCTGLRDSDIDINVWIGPSGTISPLHSDPKDNIFCQLVGSKFFRLVPQEDASKIYLPEGMLSNTSKVDVTNPDLVKYPSFAEAKVFDGILEEGDMLYMPAGVFHYVQSLSASSSLSFWFTPLAEDQSASEEL